MMTPDKESDRIVTAICGSRPRRNGVGQVYENCRSRRLLAAGKDMATKGICEKSAMPAILVEGAYNCSRCQSWIVLK